MYRIQRFGVVRTATVVAVLYALIFGIILVPLVLLGALVGATSDQPFLGGVGLLVGLIVVLFVAAFYAAVGWVFTALACLLYNLAARWVGGIEVAVQVVPPPPMPMVPSTGWGAPSPPPSPPSAPTGPEVPPSAGQA
jgi:hypothetical protein